MGRWLLRALSEADRRSGTVRAAKNGSNASENAHISQTAVVSKSVGFRNPEMFGIACSEDSKSHVVANSVDSHLHIGKIRLIYIWEERFCATEWDWG
jgi:hypothetical protein